MRLLNTEFLQQRRLHLPAFTIVALALTLAIIITVSSYRNILREQQRFDEHLLREGTIFLRVFERRALSEILLALISGDPWKKYIQELAEDLGDEADVEYVLITDEYGRIIIHSEMDKIGGIVDADSAIGGKIVNKDSTHKVKVFEVAKHFILPKDTIYEKMPLSHKKLIAESSIENTLKDYRILIALDTQQFDDIRKGEISNIIIMSAILLIVGSVAFYFIIIIQYYYLRQSHYEQELSIAADIQKKLFPQKFPQDTGIQISAVNIMAESVGGDYYDFTINDQGQLALAIGDSMGRGISSALLMTTVRAVWQSWVVIGSKSPSETLSMVNRSVYQDMRAAGAFVTMFSALYDPTTSIFKYSNAGHHPPIFRTALTPKCRDLDVGGFPLGIFPNSEYKGDEFIMQDGDIIVIYTDGIVEAQNRDGSSFGLERLCDIVNQNHDYTAEDIKDIILSDLNLYTGGVSYTDDVTIVVLKK